MEFNIVVAVDKDNGIGIKDETGYNIPKTHI